MPENSSCSSASTCGRESCEGCPSKAKGGSGIAKEPMNKASNVKKVIGVVSGKGGVGKSFVTSSLACAMNKAGYKVGIMDADITGPSIPKMFGVHGQVYGTEDGMVPMAAENGIKIMSVNLLLDNEEDPVIWRGPVIAGVVKQFWNEKQRASIKEHNGNIWIGGLYCAEQLHLIFRKGKLSAGGRLAGLEVMFSKT